MFKLLQYLDDNGVLSLCEPFIKRRQQLISFVAEDKRKA